MTMGERFVVVVYETRETNPALFDIRCVAMDMDEGKDFVNKEVDRMYNYIVHWRDQFGGSVAQLGGLTYEVRPTKTALSSSVPARDQVNSGAAPAQGRNPNGEAFEF